MTTSVDSASASLTIVFLNSTTERLREQSQHVKLRFYTQFRRVLVGGIVMIPVVLGWFCLSMYSFQLSNLWLWQWV